MDDRFTFNRNQMHMATLIGKIWMKLVTLVTFMGLSEIPPKFHGVESQNFPVRGGHDAMCV